jgi:NitT/TauT family transport system ATP-binding protein
VALTKLVGMDFQEKSTFPGGTRARHCFPLEIAGMVKTERRAKARRFIALVGLTEFEKRHRPSRPPACATILLMHEPLASLDDQTRLLLSNKMLQIQHELSQTTLLITHNITESVQLSDRILVMARRRNQSARPDTSKISSCTAFGRYVAEIWSDLREEAARSTQESEMGARDGKRLITATISG